MNQLNLASMSGAAILIIGLVSCSKEELKQDIYRVPSPVVKQPEAQYTLNQLDGKTQKSLDLHDTFDASGGGPVKVQITSHCRIGENHYEKRAIFYEAAQIDVFGTMPDEVLTADFRINRIECSFEFESYNQLGSRHIFTLQPLKIEDRAAGKVRLEREPSQENISPLRIDASSTSPVRIRYDSSGSAAAVVLCQDMALKPLGFEKVLDFSLFDIKNPALNAGKTTDDLSFRPLQNCRILISERGRIMVISNAFQLLVPRPELGVSYTQLPLRGGSWEQVTSNQHWIALISSGTVLFSEMQLNNPTAAPRRIRLPKGPIHSFVTTIREETGKPAVVRSHRFSNLYITVQANHETEDEQHFSFTIPGGGSMMLQASLRAIGKARCLGSHFPTDVKVEAAPFVLEEISEAGDVISRAEISPGPPMLLNWTRTNATPQFWANLSAKDPAICQ